MSDSEDPIDTIDDGGDDLFGDEDDDQITSPKDRVLDDDDLASDPEQDGYNRYRDDAGPAETANRVVMGVQTYRHRIPKTQDGSLRVLRVPKFVRFMPQVYDPETFQPSEFDIANAKSDRPKHVARVRRDAQTNELKSNTNIYRWSDGSVTISVAGEQYEIGQKKLAPAHDGPYNEIHDAHYYAAAAEISSNVLMTVGHVTEQYNIKPNKDVGDDALSVLAEKMAQASKPSREGELIVKTTIDPELQSRQIELAEKERMKAQRLRENAAARMDGGLGRSSGRGGGLSVGDLEGGRRGAGSGRKRAAGGQAKRRRPEYDSDDEVGVRRHEEYDKDDFVVDSEEEEEEVQTDDDEEEELVESEEEERRPRRNKRQRTEEASDEDAEGDDLDAAAENTSRARRRNVIDDDDSE